MLTAMGFWQHRVVARPLGYAGFANRPTIIRIQLSSTLQSEKNHVATKLSNHQIRGDKPIET